AAEDEILQLLEVRRVEATAQLILTIGDFDGAATGLLKRTLHGREHVLQGDATLAEERREQLDLILLLETADRCDLGDAWRRLQRRFDQAFVEEPQLTQVASLFVIDQRVLKDPAHAAGVRANGHIGVRRQLRANRVEAILDELTNDGPAAGVPQDHVDEGEPHVRGAAYRLH